MALAHRELVLLDLVYGRSEPVDLLELATESGLEMDDVWDGRDRLLELGLVERLERRLDDRSALTVYQLADVRAAERALGLYAGPPGALSRPSALAGA
jgi:hypothetical protein